MLNIHVDDKAQDLGFDIPVCCGGDIHYVTLYDDGHIVATTHEEDPDAWLSQTISDLTGEQPECDWVIDIMTPRGTNKRLAWTKTIPNTFAIRMPHVPLYPIDLIQVMFNITRYILASMDYMINKELFKFLFNDVNQLGKKIQEASQLYDKMQSKKEQSIKKQRKIDHELSIIEDNIKNDSSAVSFLLDEEKDLDRITEDAWAVMKTYETFILSLPIAEIIEGVRCSIDGKSYCVPSTFAQWHRHTITGIRDYIYYSNDKRTNVNICSELAIGFFTKTIKTHHNTFVHSMPKESLLPRCEKGHV